MTRRIEQIQQIDLPGFRAIIHRHRMRFDRDPAFAFEVHRIEQLVLLVALVNRPRRLEQSIRQSCFAVIDVRDDAEIARQFDSHESRTMRARAYWVNCSAFLRNAFRSWRLTQPPYNIATNAETDSHHRSAGQSCL